MKTTQSQRIFSILLFDDDVVFYHLLKADLESFSYLHHLVSYNRSVKIDFNIYDAILVDLDFGGDLSGDELILFLKNLNLSVPLIVLSADENITTKLRVLKLGIDDYLWKSMHKEEIQIRIFNSIQLRKENAPASLGNLKLTRTFNLLLDGEQIEASKIEYKFLDLIISQFPNPTPLADLLKNVWNQEHINKGTINTLVWNLNKKLATWQYRLSFQQETGILISKKEFQSSVTLN